MPYRFSPGSLHSDNRILPPLPSAPAERVLIEHAVLFRSAHEQGNLLGVEQPSQDDKAVALELFQLGLRKLLVSLVHDQLVPTVSRGIALVRKSQHCKKPALTLLTI
jgi:hypothetical protein